MQKSIIFIALLVVVLPFTNALDSFSFNLYNQVANTANGNVILSPFSVKMAMSMCSEGAVGQTQTQILSSCNLPTIQKTRLTQMLQIMQGCQQNEEQNYTLTIANSLWTSQQNPPLSSYVNTVKNNYLAQVSALNFNNPSLAASTVNEWISAHTDNLINNVLSADAITPDTYMILVNAIYFKGTWQTPFKTSNTQQKTFYSAANSFSQVPMMAQYSQNYLYYSDSNIQMAELPYIGNQIVMDIILPIEQSNLGSVESDLATNFNTYIQNMESHSLDLYVPKFKFDVQQSLNNYLQNLGISNAFNPATADFSGIDGKQDLSISSVIQQAYIEVDETGTKAAAATVVTVVDECVFRPINFPIVMNCNHPFVFVLRNIQTQQILFVGRVQDPVSSS